MHLSTHLRRGHLRRDHLRRGHRRRGRFVAVLAVLLLGTGMAACGSDSSADDSGSADSGTGQQADGTFSPDSRVLAFGEERLLADLLALGIKPVASSANVIVDSGFHGLDQFDTDGIVALSGTDPNIEHLGTFGADVVVANEFVADQLGMDILERLGDVFIVPDGDVTTQVLAVGEAFGRRAEAEALVAELESELDAGRDALEALPEEMRTVSVATIYSGPTLAAWVDGPVDVPSNLIALGFTLRPGPDDVSGLSGGFTGGRTYISEEQIDLFGAPTLVLLQTELVEGEDEAIAEISDRAVWQMLPAVQDDRVFTFDRLGYPGIVGHTRLVDDLVDALAP